MHKKTRNLNVLRSIYLRQGNSFDPCVGVVDVVYREWIWPFFFRILVMWKKDILTNETVRLII